MNSTNAEQESECAKYLNVYGISKSIPSTSSFSNYTPKYANNLPTPSFETLKDLFCLSLVKVSCNMLRIDSN